MFQGRKHGRQQAMKGASSSCSVAQSGGVAAGGARGTIKVAAIPVRIPTIAHLRNSSRTWGVKKEAWCGGNHAHGPSAAAH